MKIGFCFLIYDKINLEELWELDHVSLIFSLTNLLYKKL